MIAYIVTKQPQAKNEFRAKTIVKFTQPNLFQKMPISNRKIQI